MSQLHSFSFQALKMKHKHDFLVGMKKMDIYIVFYPEKTSYDNT